MTAKHKTALILVDLQNDFCKGGNLAVPNGDDVIPLANQLQAHFHLVVATQDWHPQDHKSFASNNPGHQVRDMIDLKGVAQVLWPDHCVQQSHGAEFHPVLDTKVIHKIILKGIDKEIDSYSAFFDNAHLRSTRLAEYLREHDVQDVFIMGLATDYCVKYSCLDAADLGFNVYVIADACRGIDLQAGDVDKAFAEMKEKGIKIVTVADVLAKQY